MAQPSHNSMNGHRAWPEVVEVMEERYWDLKRAEERPRGHVGSHSDSGSTILETFPDIVFL